MSLYSSGEHFYFHVLPGLIAKDEMENVYQYLLELQNKERGRIGNTPGHIKYNCLEIFEFTGFYKSINK